MSSLPTVGLVPAAGFARRLGALTHSKELTPIGGEGSEQRPVCLALLGAMAAAGIDRACLILRSGKQDIPRRLGKGEPGGPELEYLEIEPTTGVPFTLAAGLQRFRERRIVLGFPDILFRPRSAIATMLGHQTATDADVVLGLLPSDNPSKADMVELDAKGSIQRFHIKPRETDLLYTWVLATWKPSFTAFFESFLASVGPNPPESVLAAGELQVSTIVEAAMEAGLRVEGVTFPEGAYLDIGTRDDLDRARADPAPWFP